MIPIQAKLVSTMIAAVVAFGAPAALAQSPADMHRPSAAPMPGGGMDGGMPMMEMCRHMMGPMAADQKMEPKAMAAMLQMRGEMMKAMGEVMMKHGTMMMAPKDK